MTEVVSKHPLEQAADWSAPALLGAACGWAALALGLGIAAMAGGAMLGFASGAVAMRMAGGPIVAAIPAFEPATLGLESDTGELLLEERDSILELDDPLITPEPDSRVVRLFARPEPTPGELVDRIADFLGEGRSASPAAPNNAPVPDASAALHAALANIRASLR